MIQMRLKEGSDKRWFNPNRDIVNIWTKLCKKALMSFDDFQGCDGCTREQFIETAGELGKLIVHVVKDPVLPDDMQKELIKIQEKNPVGFGLISNRVFHVLMGAFTAFVADAKPKTGTDSEIPTYGLEEMADQLARKVPIGTK